MTSIVTKLDICSEKYPELFRYFSSIPRNVVSEEVRHLLRLGIMAKSSGGQVFSPSVEIARVASSPSSDIKTEDLEQLPIKTDRFDQRKSINIDITKSSGLMDLFEL